MPAIDLSIFQSIHSLSGHAAWSDALIIFAGEYLVYGLMALVGYYAYREFRAGHTRHVYAYATAILSALIARIIVVEAIHSLLQRQRPFLAHDLPHLLSEASYSFPSGHTIFIFALATGLLFVNKKLAYFVFLAGVIVGIARIAAGVHYPSDIVGGAFLGIGTAYIVTLLARKYL